MESDPIKHTVYHFSLQPEPEILVGSIVCGWEEQERTGWMIDAWDSQWRAGWRMMGWDGMGWGDGDVHEEKQGVEYRVLADG